MKKVPTAEVNNNATCVSAKFYIRTFSSASLIFAWEYLREQNIRKHVRKRELFAQRNIRTPRGKISGKGRDICLLI